MSNSSSDRFEKNTACYELMPKILKSYGISPTIEMQKHLNSLLGTLTHCPYTNNFMCMVASQDYKSMDIFIEKALNDCSPKQFREMVVDTLSYFRREPDFFSKVSAQSYQEIIRVLNDKSIDFTRKNQTLETYNILDFHPKLKAKLEATQLSEKIKKRLEEKIKTAPPALQKKF